MIFENYDVQKNLGFPSGLDESFADSVKAIIKKLEHAHTKEQLISIHKDLTALVK